MRDDWNEELERKRARLIVEEALKIFYEGVGKNIVKRTLFMVVATAVAAAIYFGIIKI